MGEDYRYPRIGGALAINKQTRSRRDPHPYRAAGQEVAPWSPLRDPAQLIRSLRGWNIHGWRLLWAHRQFWDFATCCRLLEPTLSPNSSEELGPPQAMHRYYSQVVVPALERYVLPLGEAVNGAEAYLLASPEDEGVIWPADVGAQSDFPSQWRQLVACLDLPVELQAEGEAHRFLAREYNYKTFSFATKLFWGWFHYYGYTIQTLTTVLVKWKVGKAVPGDAGRALKVLAVIRVALRILLTLSRVHPARLLLNRDFPSEEEREKVWRSRYGSSTEGLIVAG